MQYSRLRVIRIQRVLNIIWITRKFGLRGEKFIGFVHFDQKICTYCSKYSSIFIDHIVRSQWEFIDTCLCNSESQFSILYLEEIMEVINLCRLLWFLTSRRSTGICCDRWHGHSEWVDITREYSDRGGPVVRALSVCDSDRELKWFLQLRQAARRPIH